MRVDTSRGEKFLLVLIVTNDIVVKKKHSESIALLLDMEDGIQNYLRYEGTMSVI